MRIAKKNNIWKIFLSKKKMKFKNYILFLGHKVIRKFSKKYDLLFKIHLIRLLQTKSHLIISKEHGYTITNILGVKKKIKIFRTLVI